MLKGAGFDVIDLGVDIKPEAFVEQAKTTKIQLIGMSALLTTTMPGMEKTVKALKQAGISVKVMIGGAPLTQGLPRNRPSARRQRRQPDRPSRRRADRTDGR